MNMILAYPNRVKPGACTLSGGSWAASMPLANLLDPVLGIRARSADLALASTQFDAALASPWPARVLALAHHSLSQTARFRVRGSNTAGNFNVGTNELTWSEQLGHATWVNGSAVGVTPDQAVAPDGAMTMDLVARTNTVAAGALQKTISVTAGQPVTLSAHAKKASIGNLVGVRIQGVYPARVDVVVNLDTGAIAFSGANSWTGLSCVVEDKGNGVYRVHITGTPSATTAAASVLLGPTHIASGGWEGAASSLVNCYLWGAQINPGTTPDPYQPTTTTALTKGAIYDSGWLDVWPLLWSDVAWEDAHWWSGTYTPDEIDGYRFTLIHVLPSSVAASYWRVELDDTANPAGAVDIGRLFLGDGWQPLYNYNYGAAIGRQSRTKSREAQSGTRYYTRRASRRSFRGLLANLTAAEAYGDAYELQRLQDVSEECLFIPDPADAEQMWRRAMLCTLRTLSDIEHPYPNTYTMPIELEEIL